MKMMNKIFDAVNLFSKIRYDWFVDCMKRRFKSFSINIRTYLLFPQNRKTNRHQPLNMLCLLTDDN